MSIFKVKTTFGQFRVKYADNMLSVGGNKWCVQISIRDDINDSYLTALYTDSGGCEITNKEIHGALTQKMVYLAFTLVSKINPLIKHLNLIDSSSLTCHLSDGKERKMSLMKSSLLLYGKTYYERKYDAYPANPRDIPDLEMFRKNYEDPAKKPPSFSFNNSDLQVLLEPIYKETATWKEFIDKLKVIYDKKVCEYIYPWFLHALSRIAEKEITTNWRINIDDKPVINYTIIAEGGGGGKTLKKNISRRKTRQKTRQKTRRNSFNDDNLYIESEPDYEPDGLYDIKYS